MSESEFAQYIINSIRNELGLLKKHDYIQPQAYNDILNLLPKDVTTSNQSVPSIQNVPSNNPLPPPNSYNSTNENKFGTAEALYDYKGENPSTDLTIHRGDIIQLTEFVNSDWWKGSLNGKTGIFPSSYVKKLETPLNEKKVSPPYASSHRDYGQQNYATPPVGYVSSAQTCAPPPVQTYTPPPIQYNSAAPPPVHTYTPPPVQCNSSAPPPAQTYTLPPAQYNNYAPPPIQGQVQIYPPQSAQQVTTSSAIVEEHHEIKSG